MLRIALLFVLTGATRGSLLLLSRSLKQGHPAKNGGPIAPLWPETFVSNWTIFDTPIEEDGPPWVDHPTKLPYRAGRGQTYYSWPTRQILEVYEDFCINIFPNKTNWRCHFLNTDGVSYLISLDDSSPYPPCCIFGKPWSAPPPDFARANLPYNSTVSTQCGTNDIDFYTSFDNDPINTFGYGFSKNFRSGIRPGARFYFKGWTGWVSQFFTDFRPEAPPKGIFDLPDVCKGEVKNCGYLPCEPEC